MIASPNVAQSQSGPSLLGSWRLVSYEARDSEGRVHYPLGENVSGLLVYDGGSNMSAHVMRNDRPLFAAKDPARGTAAELRAAFEDYGSYFGTYTIDQTRQTVTHQVRGCLVSELDWPRSGPSFQVRRQSPVIVHSAAHMGWAIIRVRFDLGTHLMNTIRLARAPTEVASCLTNR